MKEITANETGFFCPHARLSFRAFHDVNLYGKDITLLHLESSSFVDGGFDNVSLYNATLTSTKFMNANFSAVNLGNSDICSIWAQKCGFHKTNFNNATIADSAFRGCVFEYCSFEGISLTNTQFVDCIFDQFPIHDSTVTLNTFIRCQIKDTDFTESFYYQIFEVCVFQEVDTASNLLGFNFGFSADDLLRVSQDTELSEIKEAFVESGMYINAAILHVNQTRDCYDAAMLACITAMGKMLMQDILIKTDEILFLKKMTTYLKEKGLLTPITSIRMWQILNSFIGKDEKNTANDKALPHIREFANMLYFDFHEFQSELQKKLLQLPEITVKSAEVEMKVVYMSAPSLELLHLINQFHQDLCCNGPAPQLMRTEEGSYIEWLKISEIALPYIQTFFSLLGLIIPFMIYKLEKKNNLKQESPTYILLKDHNLVPIEGDGIAQQTSSKELYLPDYKRILPNVQTAEARTGIMISDVMKITSSSKIIDSLDLCGYNPQNVKSVSVYYTRI